ncbi:TPA: 16S rRNA (guanine(527)-N(7))-methyltransferase RsmG, partial [Proteus mirabilis]|nr:16S rRNA (guanine(527)-N(7))-methyltransferase RsmG [Proteus mirabilis]
YALKGQIHQEELDELSENGLKMPEKVINLAIPELNEQRHLVIF